MDSQLDGLRVAILASDGFEQVELTEPRSALDAAAAFTAVVSPQDPQIRGLEPHRMGQKIAVDDALSDADPKDYDALPLPGGVMNPDALRMQPQAVAFVKAFFDAGKPVAAICHSPWTIVESGAAANYRMTSWPSLKTDIKNAGGKWIDQPVVVDDNLVTSRKPKDLPHFNREMLTLFGEHRAGKRASRAAARRGLAPLSGPRCGSLVSAVRQAAQA